jgi:hypothetical protein
MTEVYSHLFQNKRKPQKISAIPTTTATTTIKSFCTTLPRFIAFVIVRTAMTNIISPMKETNPPMAILSRCLSEKDGITFPSLTLSLVQDNGFAFRPLLHALAIIY